VAPWKPEHIQRYVIVYKRRATPDHGLRRRFSTPVEGRLILAKSAFLFAQAG
jgi:hypothetical protein